MSNLPDGITDVPDSRNALDCGITIDDWSDADPDGYDEAIIEEFERDWPALLSEKISEGRASGRVGVSREVRKMEKRLESVVASNPQWVKDWMAARFGE